MQDNTGTSFIIQRAVKTKVRENSTDLFASKYKRDSCRSLGSLNILKPWEFLLEDMTIEKQDGSERLVLS